jgi:predicted dehydrogenase
MTAGTRRVALAGTGHRGTGTWGRDLLTELGDRVGLVGLFDSNPMRLAAAQQVLGGTPTYSDFNGLLALKPDTLIVCTRDDTHADYIVAALEAGIDVITEKPMATTDEMCRRILAAEARTGRRVDVAFNYRFAPTSRKIKELLASGVIGEIASVDFHWYLDIEHGADYFRRWHALMARSGGLFVHKATHHFDLLNWYLDSEPDEVFARGALRNYGRAGPYRGVRCKGCAHAGYCDFHFDMGADPWLDALYEAPAVADGYFRDACVYREEIDIYDTMSAAIRYLNGVQVSYSLNSFMPIEGYHLAFNGRKGRIKIRMYERQGWEMPDGVDEIVVMLNAGRAVERIKVEHGPGGHFGGDPLLRRMLFAPGVDDPLGQRAGARAGAMSVLTGVACNLSAAGNRPVRVVDLLEEPAMAAAG